MHKRCHSKNYTKIIPKINPAYKDYIAIPHDIHLNDLALSGQQAVWGGGGGRHGAAAARLPTLFVLGLAVLAAVQPELHQCCQTAHFQLQRYKHGSILVRVYVSVVSTNGIFI